MRTETLKHCTGWTDPSLTTQKVLSSHGSQSSPVSEEQCLAFNGQTHSYSEASNLQSTAPSLFLTYVHMATLKKGNQIEDLCLCHGTDKLCIHWQQRELDGIPPQIHWWENSYLWCSIMTSKVLSPTASYNWISLISFSVNYLQSS